MNKFTIFSKKSHLFSLKKPKLWMLWEILLFQSHSTATLLSSASWKNSVFFQEAHLFTLKEPKFWMLWKILLFQLHSTANLLLLVILKKFKIFWNNPSIFSKRDPKFEHFEKSVAFCGVFATFIVFWLNSRFFPGRTHLLLEKQQTLNVLLNRTISVAFYGKLATLSNLKKFTITLGNPIYFFFF